MRTDGIQYTNTKVRELVQKKVPTTHNPRILIRPLLLELIIVFGLLLTHLSAVMAEEMLPATPGILHGTGTSFALTDSDYLNVSITSSAEIDLHLVSIPTIINMSINTSTGVTSSDITLGGLEADTSYWIYQNVGVVGVEITSDAKGNYSFTVDLTEPRSFRIQPDKSTINISDDGASGTGNQCTLVGTWDAVSKTCTLTQDVNDAIYISSFGVTLDGNGYQVNLPNSSSYNYVTGSNHTIKNLTINGYSHYHNHYGLYLSYADSATVDNVTVSNTYFGVYIEYSRNNTVSNSTFSVVRFGAYLHGEYYDQSYCDNGDSYYCGVSGNTLTNNTFMGSNASSPYGIYLGYAAVSNNTVSGNSISGFNYGLYLRASSYDSGGNTLYLNNITDSNTYGMTLSYRDSDNNTVYQNEITGGYTGMYHVSNYSSSNTVYQNNISSNAYALQVEDSYSTGNAVYNNNFIDNTTLIHPNSFNVTSSPVFNLDAPIGGNYYSNYDEPTEGCSDSNGDGFCDTPYVAYTNYEGITDYLPWTYQDGWLNEPPVADANGPYLVAVGEQALLDGSASSDPDGDALTETWIVTGGTVLDNLYTAGNVAGIYDIQLVVNDGWVDSEPAYTTVVVYDPDGGSVNGGGWIDSPAGAYMADPTLTGKANFKIAIKYVQDASKPIGKTRFRFKAGNLKFQFDSYEWLVVNQDSTNAQYKGRGTINGDLAPNGELYVFMIWAGEGDSSATEDTFRIRIWYEDEADGTEYDVYDNGVEQALGGGSIQVHTGG